MNRVDIISSKIRTVKDIVLFHNEEKRSVGIASEFGDILFETQKSESLFAEQLVKDLHAIYTYTTKNNEFALLTPNSIFVCTKKGVGQILFNGMRLGGIFPDGSGSTLWFMNGEEDRWKAKIVSFEGAEISIDLDAQGINKGIEKLKGPLSCEPAGGKLLINTSGLKNPSFAALDSNGNAKIITQRFDFYPSFEKRDIYPGAVVYEDGSFEMLRFGKSETKYITLPKDAPLAALLQKELVVPLIPCTAPAMEGLRTKEGYEPMLLGNLFVLFKEGDYQNPLGAATLTMWLDTKQERDETIEMAQKRGYECVVLHDSDEKLVVAINHVKGGRWIDRDLKDVNLVIFEKNGDRLTQKGIYSPMSGEEFRSAMEEYDYKVFCHRCEQGEEFIMLDNDYEVKQRIEISKFQAYHRGFVVAAPRQKAQEQEVSLMEAILINMKTGAVSKIIPATPNNFISSGEIPESIFAFKEFKYAGKRVMGNEFKWFYVAYDGGGNALTKPYRDQERFLKALDRIDEAYDYAYEENNQGEKP